MSIPTLDKVAFAQDIEALHQKLKASIGPEDLRHLKKIERWGRICSLLGYATAWIFPNPISAFLMSQGNVTRWAMMAHHVRHRGYDRIAESTSPHHSKTFAKGWRRFIDWPDWIYPDAWAYEHNTLHHYHTGEILDPDVLEHRVRLMREVKAPRFLKHLVAFFFASHWKLSYYAPNTLWMLQQREARLGRDALHAKIKGRKPAIFHGAKLWWPFHKAGAQFWLRCVFPYALFRFAFLPLLFLPLGRWAVLSVLINSLLAEWITNLHTFLIIVPNHSGDDVYRFEGGIEDKADFYLRQTVGSVNYTGGTDLKDFLQGWLNYQIEHHLWPDLPLLKYQQAQPEVQAICEKHGVPYINDPLPRRVSKMWALLTGQRVMKQWQEETPSVASAASGAEIQTEPHPDMPNSEGLVQA